MSTYDGGCEHVLLGGAEVQFVNLGALGWIWMWGASAREVGEHENA